MSEQDARDQTQDDVSWEVLDENGELVDDDDDDGVQPGMTGPVGTGVEGADQALDDDREEAAGAEGGQDYIVFGEDQRDVDFEDEFGQDDSAAAEQGNRASDQMVAEGEDAREVLDLDGDVDDIDVIDEEDDLGVEKDLDESLPGADIDGSIGGEDPLAGEPLV